MVCAMLGATTALCLALFVVTPSYSATLKLYVSGAGSTADDRLQSGEYARTHVASYADLVDSDDVLSAVRDSLGLPLSQDGSYRDLADDISASNPLNTLIIDVTVKDASPQRAQAVAAAIGQVYDPVVARLESPSSGKGSPVRINVVTPAAVPVSKDSPSAKLYAAVGLLAGVSLGIGAAWLLELGQLTRPHRSATKQSSSDPWPWWPEQASTSATSQATDAVEVLVSPNGERQDAMRRGRKK